MLPASSLSKNFLLICGSGQLTTAPLELKITDFPNLKRTNMWQFDTKTISFISGICQKETISILRLPGDGFTTKQNSLQSFYPVPIMLVVFGIFRVLQIFQFSLEVSFEPGKTFSSRSPKQVLGNPILKVRPVFRLYMTPSNVRALLVMCTWDQS